MFWRPFNPKDIGFLGAVALKAPRELVRLIDDRTGPLAAALSRLGRGLMRKECESAERSESRSSC